MLRRADRGASLTRPATISSYRKDDVYYPRFTLRSTELRDAGFAACDTVWLVVYEHYIELAAQLPASTDGIQRATQHEISPYQSGARIVIGAEDLQPGGFSIGDEVQVDVQTGLLAIEWIAAGAVREKELPLLENVK